MNIDDLIFYGNSVLVWLTASGIAMVCGVTLIAARKFIVRRLRVFARNTATQIDDLVAEVLDRTRGWFLLIVSLSIGASTLTLPASVTGVMRSILVGGLLLQGALWANAALMFWLNSLAAQSGTEDKGGRGALTAVRLAAKLGLWSITLVLLLENLGVNITGLIAGLGIGGIAAALALQSILGDLFASFSIALDKPFVVGDFIIVDDHLGTVEKIGLKSSRIRSLSGEQIIFSNADLLRSRVRNYKRMSERRVLFTVGITYQTPFQKLERLSGLLREIIASTDGTRLDRVHFKEFADSSLLFEAVYYVTSADYNRYMDIQQAINLEIYRRFSEEGIEFAYPTRTIYIQHEGNGTIPHSRQSGSDVLAPSRSS